ncbi:hypothetical protein GE21DRAFT_1220452 [Neurospora crassa]|nr:hypothetical protein GE21DRAFT_1220452 [Neurospora crassa]
MLGQEVAEPGACGNDKRLLEANGRDEGCAEMVCAQRLLGSRARLSDEDLATEERQPRHRILI